MNSQFLRSRKWNGDGTERLRSRVNGALDPEPFPIEIGHLVHLLKKIFFVIPGKGVLQTGESLLSPFRILFWQKLQVHVVSSGENETVKRWYFLPWNLIITCPRGEYD